MSMNMVGRSTEFRVKSGSRITLQLTITDDGGTAKNLTNTVTYNILDIYICHISSSRTRNLLFGNLYCAAQMYLHFHRTRIRTT